MWPERWVLSSLLISPRSSASAAPSSFIGFGLAPSKFRVTSSPGFGSARLRDALFAAGRRRPCDSCVTASGGESMSQTDEELVKELLEIEEGLTAWETDFAESVAQQVDAGRELT